MTKNSTIYRVVFVQNDEIVELYAKHIAEMESMFGFIAVEGFMFGEKSTVVVDPSEERLKALFSGVKRTYIPMQEVVRIDEVEKQGTSKITPLPKGSVVSPFPQRIPTNRGGDN